MGKILSLLVILSLSLSAGPKVEVSPQTVFAGGTVTLTCRVPADVDNRRIGFGIADFSESERDVEGTKATFRITIQRIPCEATTAYCSVAKSTGKVEMDTKPIIVGGCGN